MIYLIAGAALAAMQISYWRNPHPWKASLQYISAWFCGAFVASIAWVVIGLGFKCAELLFVSTLLGLYVNYRVIRRYQPENVNLLDPDLDYGPGASPPQPDQLRLFLEGLPPEFQEHVKAGPRPDTLLIETESFRERVLKVVSWIALVLAGIVALFSLAGVGELLKFHFLKGFRILFAGASFCGMAWLFRQAYLQVKDFFLLDFKNNQVLWYGETPLGCTQEKLASLSDLRSIAVACAASGRYKQRLHWYLLGRTQDSNVNFMFLFNIPPIWRNHEQRTELGERLAALLQVPFEPDLWEWERAHPGCQRVLPTPSEKEVT